MWADTLLDVERAHLLRLTLWSVASVLTGTILMTLARGSPRRSPLLFHVALQTVAWGVAELLLVWTAYGSLALRGLASARRLERFLWFNAGLDAGYVAVGVTLALAGWTMGRRLAPVGAGLAVVVQGIALLLLDLVIANQLSTMV